MDLREFISTLLMASGFGLLFFAFLPLSFRLSIAVSLFCVGSFLLGYLASYYYSRGENE